MRHRQRTQQQSIDQREDCGVCAHAESQGQQRHRGKARRLAQLPCGVTQVLSDGVDEGDSARFPAVCSDWFKAAEIKAGLTAGLFGSEARLKILCFLLLEMEAQLIVELSSTAARRNRERKRIYKSLSITRLLNRFENLADCGRQLLPRICICFQLLEAGLR